MIFDRKLLVLNGQQWVMSDVSGGLREQMNWFNVSFSIDIIYLNINEGKYLNRINFTYVKYILFINLHKMVLNNPIRLLQATNYQSTAWVI